VLAYFGTRHSSVAGLSAKYTCSVSYLSTERVSVTWRILTRHHSCMYVYLCGCMYVCSWRTLTQRHDCMYVCVYVGVCMYMHICVPMYVCDMYAHSVNVSIYVYIFQRKYTCFFVCVYVCCRYTQKHTTVQYTIYSHKHHCKRSDLVLHTKIRIYKHTNIHMHACI
jgi:hypothetical protein